MTAARLLRRSLKTVALAPGLLRRPGSGDLVVLLYHLVGVGDREIDVPLAQFEGQIERIASTGRVTTLDQALSATGSGGVVVTFDDGFRDFHDHVLPVLERHRVPALLYLATGFVDAPPAPGRGPEPITWSQLEEAVSTGLVTVGSHTHSHADLSRASEQDATTEMRRSQELIEDRLGRPCRHFSYPWSFCSPGAAAAARRHFDSAALSWKTNRAGRVDPYDLGRTPILRGDDGRFFDAKLSGRLDGEAHVYRLLRRGPWRKT